MAPLACDPTALDRAGATVLSTGESLGSVITTLTAALSGSAGMAGDDPVGAALGRTYNGAAAKVIEAMTFAAMDSAASATACGCRHTTMRTPRRCRM